MTNWKTHIPEALLGVLAIYSLVISLLYFQKPKDPEFIYVPQEIIVERIIQQESIPVNYDYLMDRLANIMGDDWEEVEEYMEDNDLRPVHVSTVTSEAEGSSTSTDVTPSPCLVTSLDDTLSLSFGDVQVPVARVSLDTEGNLTREIYDMTLELVNILSENEGTPHILSRLSLTSRDVVYQLPINGQTYYVPQEPDEEETPTKRFRLLDPRLDIGASVVYSDHVQPNVSIGMSLSSINSPGNIDWRFLRVGYDNDFDGNHGITVAPFTYNIANHIPLLSDLHIHPQVGVSLPSLKPTYGIGLTSVF